MNPSSPRYLRRRSSSDANGYVPPYGRESIHTTADEEHLRVTGLRRKKLMTLLIWLGVLTLLVIILFTINITLIRVLQMRYQGMTWLRFHTYLDDKNGNKQVSSVHFTAQKIDLGHVVANSGKVLGTRDKRLIIHGSRVIVNTKENGTRLVLQDGLCRLENVEQFQVVSGINGKTLFSAQHPLVTIDRKIKQISAKGMITNKIRSPVNENLKIETENANLRGNEGIQLDSKAINATAKTTLLLKTSKDGSIRFNGKKIHIGNRWKVLSLSTSPALTASVDAFRDLKGEIFHRGKGPGKRGVNRQGSARADERCLTRPEHCPDARVVTSVILKNLGFSAVTTQASE
ncbi:sarcoglycan complex subunit protein [Ditylenchus destructor]|nr:sarcoglycan complex subunit protein [Ditylenchus destructor]